MFQKPRNLKYINNKRKVRPEGRALRWVAFIFLVGLIVLSMALTACNIDDDRDICCDDITIVFRYSKGGEDLFSQHIHAISHYIFNEEQVLTEVIEEPRNLQQIKPSHLASGKYTIVSIGNMTRKTRLADLHVGTTTLRQMELYMNTLNSEGCMENGDRLYFGSREFERIKDRETRYISDMSNIHCLLGVTVKWEDDAAPYKQGDYRMGLREVPAKNLLNVTNDNRVIVANPLEEQGWESTRTKVVHAFPPAVATDLTSHCLTAPIDAHRKVRGQFITLRYTDDLIPHFRLYRENEAVMKEIDLSRLFTAWNWAVSSNIEQVYDIEIEIKKDGTVVVTQGLQAGVLDWEDGGTIIGRP